MPVAWAAADNETLVADAFVLIENSVRLQELFKKVIPHQCLGAVWSRRDKSRSTEAASVLATVSQFNAVSFRVMSTVLMDPNLKYLDRAKIIATWIDIAQIKLLQGAANAYNFVEDGAFDRWFDSILILDEREAYRLSCSIESENFSVQYSSSTPSTCADHSVNAATAKQTKYEHKKSDSMASTSSDSSCQFYYDLSTDSLQSSPRTSFERKKSFSQISSSSSASSTVSTSDNSHAVGGADKIIKATGISSPAAHNSMSCLPSTEFYIIRVTTETDTSEAEGIVLYKSIMLSNNERTPQVIRNAMIKLGILGNPENYTLSQIFPDKELVLPANANVFYAVNTAYDLNFILRKKEKLATERTRYNFTNKCKNYY
ncbi:Ral guanine nucleotide dissociation stimulator-like 1 [Sarracenia purpurea var. burkii]